LNNGISKQVTKLDYRWFYRNEAVKILLPEELKSGCRIKKHWS
jgi:hypothetical protein